MPKREIKIRSFVWTEKFKDYDGKTRVRNRMARRGETVELDETWTAYGEDMGAFVTEADRKAAASDDIAALADSVTEMGPDELMNWVSEATIPQVLGVAQADPGMVGSLLDAENKATGNDPRSGLVEGLARIVGSGEGSTPEATAPEASDEAKALAEKLSLDLSVVAEEQGVEGEIQEDDVKEFYEDKADATDGARELADAEDVYLADVTGSGQDGRITKDDVQSYIDEQGAKD